MFQPESSTLNDLPSKAVIPFLGWLTIFSSKYATSAQAKTEKPTRRFPKPKGYKKYTYSEVTQHTSPDDAWLIIEDKVYDVSGMVHPGGDVIFSYAGRDASELVSVMHKNQPRVRGVMKAYLIGELVKPDRAELLQDFNSMLESFSQRGLLKASPFYYTRKLAELLAMVAIAMYLNFTYPQSWPALFLSSFVMGCFFWQAGWTQHDFHHNQVFTSHKLNALVGSWVIGLGMGGSAHWWKTKHNQHHATPNKMDHSNEHPLDPDIDTVPLFAWSEALLKQVNVPDRGIIVLQHILIWPMLLVALINWQIQSIIHVLQYPNITTKQRTYEMSLMMIHYVWTLSLAFLPFSFARGLAFWLLSHCVGGFVTSFVFIQSHNAMEIYTEDLDFVTSQMVSTRNINPGLIADWVMGGLNYQIEHHLFPTMPRHRFSQVRQEVIAFCNRNGLPYESCSIWESTYKVYCALASIAKLA